MVSPDERLGLIPPMSWLVTTSPYLTALLVFLVTPGGVWLARAIGGRILLPSDEFRSFNTNKWFSVVAGCNVVLISTMPNRVMIEREAWWVGLQIVLVAVWIAIGLFHRSTETPHMNKGQRTSLTSLFHDAFVYALVGPTMTLTTIIGFVGGAWGFQHLVLRGVIVWVIVRYVRAVRYDMAHPDARTYDGILLLKVAHVDHSYPWQWTKRPGHIKWWLDRYNARIGQDWPWLGWVRRKLNV